MTLTALTFSIATDGDTLGIGVISPAARYASVQLAGVKRLIRRHASPVQWIEIERLIALGVDAAPMTSGVFHDVLAAGDQDKVVAYLHTIPIDAQPTTTVEALDGYLRNQPIELRLRLREQPDTD
jgi:hypothetical protein